MNNISNVVDTFYRKAKLAENQLLVAALRRDAGEIDDSQLSLVAIQYAAACAEWRYARQVQANRTEMN
jgi:hypothetical protein